MELNKRKTLSFFSIFYMIFTIIIIVFYLLFTQIYNKDFSENYTKNYQKEISSILTESINSEYDYFNSLITNNDITDLNNNLSEFNKYNNNSYIRFGNISNNTITLDNESFNISDDRYLLNTKIGLKNNLLYYFNNNKFLTINFINFLEKTNNLSVSDELIIMNNQGLILYSRSGSHNNKLLSNYLSINTSNYFDKYFSLNQDIIIHSKLNNIKVLTNFSSLDSFNNIYIGQTYNYSNIKNMTKQNIYFTLVIIIIYIIMSYIVLILIFRYLSSKNSDIESNKIKLSYVKSYIVRLDFKGNITKLNEKFKNNIINSKELKTIEDISKINNLNKELSIELIERGKPLTLIFNEVVLRFLPLKIKNGYYLVGENVNEFKVDHKQLEYLAYYDEVTQLPNKNLLKYTIEKALNNKDLSGGLIGFTIKGFVVNDKLFNKKTSNEVLNKVKSTIDSNYDHNNCVLYKTEENYFIIKYNNLNNDELIKMTNIIINAFNKPIKVSSNVIKIDLTAGVLPLKDEESFDNIYSKLKLAITKSVNSSLTNITFYDQTLKEQINFKAQMEIDLIKAIDKKEFLVYLQPQYSNNLKRIIGFESLIRWNHPQYINRSPEEFIKIAEENSLIVGIGEIVIEKTFEIARRLKDYNLNFSINVSPVQLLQQGFVDDLLSKYNKYGLTSGTISIEITETYLVQSFAIINEKLKLLRKNGIKVHLDDFGTGYSSLPYLKELVFDAIKIDREYIMHIESDKYHRSITTMIINLAKSLDVEIIAEGVENEEQNKFLVKNGCSIIQGFYISKAISFEDAFILLQQYNYDNNHISNRGKVK